MSEVSILKQFYRFNRRVRQSYIKAFQKLPKEELLRDRGASYPSILDIFDHVLEAYDFWFFQVLGVKSEIKSANSDSARTIDGVIEHERFTGDAVMLYTEKLTDDDLDKEIKFSESAPASRLGDICWHMVEEELQHRGELNALMWQMDFDPPIGTYDQWLESQSSLR